jgi:hypothetical protein
MGWGCSWYREAENRCNILVRKPCGEQPLVERRRNYDENIMINFREMEFEVPTSMNLF